MIIFQNITNIIQSPLYVCCYELLSIDYVKKYQYSMCITYYFGTMLSLLCQLTYDHHQ